MKTPTPISLHDLPTLDQNTQLLACELTAQEWTDRATAAALLLHEAEQLEAALKEHTRDAKAEIKFVREEAAKAFEAVREHAEPRPVVVRIVADLGRGEAVEVRTDTGEPIARRALTDTEAAAARQSALAFPTS